jgi:hypothetical protein
MKKCCKCDKEFETPGIQCIPCREKASSFKPRAFRPNFNPPKSSEEALLDMLLLKKGEKE